MSDESYLQSLIEQITLNQPVIQGHIQREYDGNLAAFGRAFLSDSPPHRATVLRWVSEAHQGLPKSAQRLRELANTLDVDPFVLLRIPRAIFKELCAHSSWITQWGKYHKSLTFLSDLIGLGQEPWPAAHLAEHYEGEWQSWDLEYIASKSEPHLYTLYLQPEVYYDLESEQVTAKKRQNQVWYIAVRDARSQGDGLIGHGLWRPFGIFFVAAETEHAPPMLNLLNLGTGEWETCAQERDCFGVSFFCGPGTSIFRVASLHAFEVVAASDDSLYSDCPVLPYRFPA